MGVRKQHNINVIAFPPHCPLCHSLSADPVSTLNLYGPTGQQAPLTHYTLPEGPHNLYGNRAGGARMLGGQKYVEKEEIGEGERWKKSCMKNESQR